MRIVSHCVVKLSARHRVRRQVPDRSDSRKADGGMIAQRGDGFQCHVAAALDRPLVVLLEQDRSDEADDGIFIGEDADDLGAALDLAIDPFERIGNRYEVSRCLRSRCGVLHRGVWCDHRDRGTGSTKCGQADTHDEPRARVSSWPPLRLARLR